MPQIEAIDAQYSFLRLVLFVKLHNFPLLQILAGHQSVQEVLFLPETSLPLLLMFLAEFITSGF